MKELYQVQIEVIKLKQWENVREMMHITFKSLEKIEPGYTVEHQDREDNHGDNPLTIHMPTYLGKNFHIGQKVNISISSMEPIDEDNQGD